MLKNHLNLLPHTKFILIEDSFEDCSEKILDYFTKTHEKHLDSYQTHFFTFGGIYNRLESNCGENVILHDFTSDFCDWLTSKVDFESTISGIKSNCVVIIDSLAHFIYKYGLAESYRILNDLKNQKNILQTITTIHVDLLENSSEIVQLFQHLATLTLTLNSNVIDYTYKKLSGKIIKATEQYKIENNELIVSPIEKFDPKKFIEKNEDVRPENLTTFKIGLSNKDKLARDKLVLPYLPRSESGGKIEYTFDKFDDWDEEDPDDDLDI